MIDRLVEYQAKERLLSPLFCTTIISRFAQFGKYFFEVVKMSEKKLSPQKRYDAKNTKRFNVVVVKTTEMDIFKKLSSVPNVSGYIKSLIRKDIEGNG